MAAADCKPNKSLRTTIKVFLRTEEKKREALRLKDEKNTPPDTPVQVAAAPEVLPQIEETSVVPEATAFAAIDAEENPIKATEADIPATEAQQDIPQQSIEVILRLKTTYATLTNRDIGGCTRTRIDQ